MSQIGKAYIEIIADLKKFPAELRTKLKAALKEGLAGVEFEGLEQQAKAAGEKAGDAAGDGFTRRVKKKLNDSGKAGGLSFLGSLVKVFNTERNSKGDFFESVSKLFSSATETGLKGMAEKFGQFANTAGQIGGAASSAGGVVGSVAQIAAIAILAPVIVGLAGAVLQLSAALFALPAAAGVGVAAILPLVIAFQGVGEAIGAGMSGDMEKFNAALKGLAEPARTVVKEIVGLKGIFSAIKRDVQSAFFAPLVGQFRLLGATVLPVARAGLADVADSLGNLVRQLFEVATAAPNLAILRDLFATTSKVVGDIGPALADFFQGMLTLIPPALPFIERLAKGFRGIAFDFNEFTAKITRDGTLSGWLKRAWDIGKKLWDLFKQVGAFVGTILNSVGDEGTDTIRGMADAFKDLNTYLKSPEGEEFLHNLGVLVHWAGNAVVFFIEGLKASFLALNITFDLVRLLADGLEALGGAVWTAIKAVGRFFAMIGGWLVTAGSAIGNFFTETIPEWFGKVVDFFAELPGKILDGLKSLQETLRDWFVGLLTSWYEGVLFKIGQIIGLFLSLPQLIPAAISNLGQLLSDAWDAVWGFVTESVSSGIHGTIAMFEAIPGLLATAGSAIWGWASDLWTKVWDTTTSLISGGIDKVIDFFTGIPGRIRALGPMILDAARWVGHKIADGLTEIGNFASDLGKKVTNALKSGINWVIDSINRGIADIDDKLPGSLPRIPKLARGAIVDSPTLALVGEAGPEVVVPLGNPQRAQELAEQSGLLAMLRGAGSQTVVNVTAYLDPTGAIIPITRTVVNETLDEQGTELGYARAA